MDLRICIYCVVCVDMSFGRGMLLDVHTSQLRQTGVGMDWTCLHHVHDRHYMHYIYVVHNMPFSSCATS